ncbi:MAG: acyl--CoA ligase [Deltaproteobacteria bacterium]|jgi:long-chain acyl-CoA synthetase|nr:acyl--CoA ligase [Deltaproteobacteria bacterium]
MNYKTLVEAVAHAAQNLPDKTGLIEVETGLALTYGEFWRLARAFAQGLILAGLEPGGRVVVHTEQRLAVIVAQYGIYLAGGVFVPIDANTAPLRILELMREVAAGLLVAPRNIPGHDAAYLALDAAMRDDAGPASGNVLFPDPEAVCDIFFTSGTTGKPKGVMLSYKNQYAASENVVAAVELAGDDTVMVVQRLSRPGGVRSPGAAFIAGAAVIMKDGTLFADRLFDACARYAPTILIATPAHLAIPLGSAPQEFAQCLKGLHACILISDASPKRQKTMLRDLLPHTRLFNSYGLTEAGYSSLFEFSRRPDCIGQGGKNTRMSLTDDQGKAMPCTSSDNPGRIALRGANVMRGYWKNPALTAEVLREGLLLTADMGWMDEDGLIHFLGRRDDLFSVGGYKIAPREIEEAAQALPGIKACACVPVPDAILGQVPKLFVVMEAGAEFSQRKILWTLRERLELYKIPRSVEQREELPKTISGEKINKREITV